MGRLNDIRIIALYALFFVTIIGVLQQFYYPDLLSVEHFLNWDSQHYYWIKQHGYKDFRVAFFPLFPLLWKLLSVGVHGIVIINVFIFFASFYFLIKPMNLNRLETILYLSIPSSIFFFLPYSEAVFFAGSTLLILGIIKDRIWIILLALLLCTLARPAFTILIPALVLMELFGGGNKKQIIGRIALYVFVSLAGIALVGLIQYNQTGKWFVFFEVQKGWGNHLQIPQFPLRSWGGNMTTRLDGVSLIFGLVSGILLLLYILKVKFLKAVSMPKEVILSLAYLGGITASVLLFRGGSLFSLNRFVFAAPFIMVAAHYYLQQEFRFSKKQLALILTIVFLYWVSFESYVHIQALLKFLAVSVYVLLFAAIKSDDALISRVSYIAFIGLNLVFQIVFFVHFLLTEGQVGWVG